MANRPANTHPFYEAGLPSLVGVLVSILLGYGVFRFSELSQALVDGFIGYLAAALIVANLFRLAHGLTVAMRDPRYDNEIGARFNLSDMARCLTIILVPYVCLEFIRTGWLCDPNSAVVINNFLLILWYSIPHAVYLVWDLHLRHRLKEKSIDIGFVDCALFWRDWKKQRIAYADWVKVWLGLDMYIVGALVALLLLSVGITLGEDIVKIRLERNWLVGVFAALSAASMYCDYVWLNRRYYFPR